MYKTNFLQVLDGRAVVKGRSLYPKNRRTQTMASAPIIAEA
jgi:hypothetical protein